MGRMLRRSAAMTMAVALVCAGCTKDSTPKAAPSMTPVKFESATFRAIGSIGQASVVGLTPKAAVQLVDGKGRITRRSTGDVRGTAMFLDVAPGAGYTIRSEVKQRREASAPFRVLSRTDSPDPKLYAGQSFVAGLNYIRMRDGIELAMTVRLPPGKTLADGPFPTVVEYSGYEVAPPHDLLGAISKQLTDPTAPPDPLAPSTSTAVGSLIAPLLGFVTVSVQIRGSGCSGGAFDLFGLPTVYDGYDAIETVAAQPWVHAHKVGMVGISYSGFSQLFVGGTRPPHLAAVAPMSGTDDLYSGIGFPGGIQNTGFAQGWITERQRDAQPAPEGGQEWARLLVQQGDAHCAENQLLHGQAQDGVKLINSIDFRDPKLFKDRTPATWAAKIDVPMFLVGGLQDEQLDSHWIEMLDAMADHKDLWVTMYNGNHNDALAPQILTRWVEFLDLFVADRVPDVPATLVGIAGVLFKQSSGVDAEPLRQSRLAGSATVDEALATFRRDPRVRVLLDVGAGSLGAGALQPSYEQTFDSWPPKAVSPRTWFLGDGGALGTAEPVGPGGSDSYLADPAARPATSQDSSPDAPAPHFHDEPNNWLPLAAGKGLGYTSPPLTADVMIAGASSFDGYVEASATDTDLQVTLSEVRPDGNEMYVQTGWLRATHRKLDEKSSTATDPRPTHLAADASSLPRGKPALVRVPIFPVVHTFRAGSRIRVSISAVGGDRPIWTFRAIDTGTTTVTIDRRPGAQSALVLPVVGDANAGAPLPPCGTVRGQPCRHYQPSSTGG